MFGGSCLALDGIFAVKAELDLEEAQKWIDTNNTKLLKAVKKQQCGGMTWKKFKGNLKLRGRLEDCFIHRRSRFEDEDC
ncbi:hypothetical protein Tco_0791287 [Tanacetum coccineum]